MAGNIEGSLNAVYRDCRIRHHVVANNSGTTPLEPLDQVVLRNMADALNFFKRDDTVFVSHIVE